MRQVPDSAAVAAVSPHFWKVCGMGPPAVQPWCSREAALRPKKAASLSESVFSFRKQDKTGLTIPASQGCLRPTSDDGCEVLASNRCSVPDGYLHTFWTPRPETSFRLGLSGLALLPPKGSRYRWISEWKHFGAQDTVQSFPLLGGGAHKWTQPSVRPWMQSPRPQGEPAYRGPGTHR